MAPKPTKLKWGPRQLRLAIDAAGVALWSWNVDTDKIMMDDHAFDLWGVPQSPEVTFEDLSGHIHPADRDRVRAAFAATRAISGPYEIDFRIMIGRDVRWISARGQGDDADIEGRVMFGVFLDVTGRKQAEEGNELLAGEMSHRVKNLLTIATALTAITSRSAISAPEMAKDLTHRLAALGRAHLALPPQGRLAPSRRRLRWSRARHETSNVPSAQESAPYLRELVASSCKTMASVVAARSPTTMRGTDTRMRPLNAPMSS
jgi:hypothetical protein